MSKLQLPHIDISQLSLGHTLLIATLFHAVSILVLNFDFIANRPANLDQMLEITIVKPSDNEKPDKADFLATASQKGSGNTEKTEKPTQSNAIEAPVEIQTDITNRSEFSPLKRKTKTAGAEDKPVLTANIENQDKVTQNPKKEKEELANPTPAQLLANTQKQIEKLTAELDEKTRAYAKIPNRGFITASTREHVYAEYMELWRREIERTGKLNYPSGSAGKVIVVQIEIT